MVKAYLRYVHDSTFGIVSSTCNAVFTQKGDVFVTGALEGISLWKARTGELKGCLVDLSDTKSRPNEVKRLAAAPDENCIAAGFSDGSVKMWDLDRGEVKMNLWGHKKPITALCFDRSGELLASGSQDAKICIWDVVGEVGRIKLDEHSHEIAGLCFLREAKFLLSAAKDGQIKLWDIEGSHCCQTILDDKGVVWSLALHPITEHVVVGSVDADLRVYEISSGEMAAMDFKCRVGRREEGRVRSLGYSKDGRYLACVNASRSVEIFEVQSEEEATFRFKAKQEAARTSIRRLELKKERSGELTVKQEKKLNKSKRILEETPDGISLWRPLTVYHSDGKTQSVDFRPGHQFELGIANSNNTVEIVSLDTEEDSTTTGSLRQRLLIHQCGHRSGIRSVSLSSDDRLLLSTSEREAKVWNADTGSCLHTLAAGYGLAGLFAPGDSAIVIGTKVGEIQLFDLLSCTKLEILSAHKGPVWSIAALPEKSGFVSGGADSSVKIWNWTTKSAEGQKRISIEESSRLIEFESDVLAVKVSPSGSLLAAALLDSTIKILHLDTLQPFIDLYGHKLPVLSIDISADSQLLVSGSADKNIRIWGLDFGDCHKSLFAHSDSVTHVAFVYTSHYVMSVSKDGVLKYWDADKFELLLELPGHHAEVWCMAVSCEGNFVMTGSNDRSIRKWIKTDEPFFLEDEKERRLESMFEEATAEDFGESNGTIVRNTVATVAAADSLIEAMELSELESKTGEEDEANPLLLGMEPSAFVLSALQRIKPSDIETVLISLSFGDTLRLMEFLLRWLKEGRGGREMICRTAVRLLRLHVHQLASSVRARSLMQELQGCLRNATGELKDTVGFNVEAIQFVKRLRNGGSTD